MAGKAEENKKLKHDALMATAFDLFSSNGIAQTSIADIAKKAGVGKGTFYSYFHDKNDIRNHIIARKSAQIFTKAKEALNEAGIDKTNLEEQILFLVDNIIDQLTEDKRTLSFISKNLSWGVFKNVLTNETDTYGVDFAKIFNDAIETSTVKYKDPFIMIYMIIELVNASAYSSILYDEPLPIAQLKPYLHEAVSAIMKAEEIKNEA